MADSGFAQVLEASGMRRARWFWTTREIATLRDHYPFGGLAACTPLLVGRSTAAIYMKALELRLTKPLQLGALRKRWKADARVDAEIRALYEQKPTRGAVQALADRLGWPRWALSRRARELGVVFPRFKMPNWSDQELQILADNCHKSLTAVAMALRRAGFNRSETAIQVMKKRRAYRPQDNGWYTATQLAGLLGVDAKTVTRAITLKELRAQKRGTERTAAQGGDEWWINDEHVRQFVLAYPERIDLRKVEKFWFIDLLGRGPAS